MSYRFFRKVLSVSFLAMFLCVTVGACALAQQRRKVELAQRDLIGMSRESLVECAGEPAYVEMLGDRETLRYVAENPESELHKRASTCIASFTLRRGFVEHLHYETLAGRMVKQRESCTPIIEECMSASN